MSFASVRNLGDMVRACYARYACSVKIAEADVAAGEWHQRLHAFVVASPNQTWAELTGELDERHTERASACIESGYAGEETKAKTVHFVAQAFFNRGPDWVTFFREVLGVNGVVRTIFTEPKLLAEFESTPEYADIQLMLAKLREQADVLAPIEVTRVITVRLPQSLYDTLTAEAEAFGTSVNKLCISKLTQIIDGEFIPSNGPGGTMESVAGRAHEEPVRDVFHDVDGPLPYPIVETPSLRFEQPSLRRARPEISSEG